MEIDHLKSVPEDQMEMMMMTMMHMDKLPDIYASFSDAVLSPTEFTPSPSHFSDNPTVSSPNSFINSPSNITFTDHSGSGFSYDSGRWRCSGELSGGGASSGAYPGATQKKTSMAAMREMIFRIAAMQPIHIDPESVKPPKRRNVKISKDPQSVAARHRRERISERIRILQRLVPGGTKMDTASMLDEAIHYVKFLKTQVQSLERAAVNRPTTGLGFPVAMSSNGSYVDPIGKGYQLPVQNVQHFGDA